MIYFPPILWEIILWGKLNILEELYDHSSLGWVLQRGQQPLNQKTKCNGNDWIQGGQGPSEGTSCQRQGWCGKRRWQQSQSSNESNLTYRHWLVNHGVPRSKTDRTPIKFSLDLYKQKTSRSSEQKSNSNHKNRESQSLGQFLDMSQFTDPESLKGRGGWFSLGKDPGTLLKMCTADFPPAFPKGNQWLFYRGKCALGERKSQTF